MSKMHKSTEFNLLRGLPRTKRNIQTRAHEKTEHHVEVSRRYGEEYFDGPREYGYGGYKYDGRWLPVARDIVAHFGLKRGDSVLDIGCAKGYLVEDLMSVCPGLEAFGFCPFLLRTSAHSPTIERPPDTRRRKRIAISGRQICLCIIY